MEEGEGKGSGSGRDRKVKSKRSVLKVKLNVEAKMNKSGVKESEKLDGVRGNDHSKGESDHHSTEDLLWDIFDNPSPISDSTQDRNGSRNIVCKKTSRRTNKEKEVPVEETCG